MDFKETIGRQIGVAHILMLKRLDEEFQNENVPITAEQFKMMSRLWQKEGVSQQELAEGVGRNRAAAGRMIDTLERNGLLIRGAHPTDRRLNLIYLTKKGKEIRSTAQTCAENILIRANHNVEEHEQEAFQTTLKKIIENLM